MDNDWLPGSPKLPEGGTCDDARCQHCPCKADERSFMCEDCMGQADAELDALRDAERDLRLIIEARQISRQGALNTLRYVMDQRREKAAS